MSQVSASSPDLFLLDSPQDFHEYAVKMVNQARRHIQILSHDLDAGVYAAEDFVEAISAFARGSRNAQVQILVKDTKPLVEAGHKLAKLHQRLSSKIQLRKIAVEPEDNEMGFMLCDTTALLYKNDDRVYKGFANFAAAVEIKRLRETFDYVWQYGEPEPELQLLHI